MHERYDGSIWVVVESEIEFYRALYFVRCLISLSEIINLINFAKQLSKLCSA